jgi:glycosyltransferase involved in cell wall biosynthesis
VQMAETNICFGDISYAHFCFRSYLKGQWERSRPRGLRRILHWVAFRLRTLVEPFTFRRVRLIVSPSIGLARELNTEYPFTSGKVHVLSNPVDVERMRRPESFERKKVRLNLGLTPSDVVVAFVALGAYERKGLPLLIDALTQFPDLRVKLLVVGGPTGLRREYESKAVRAGLNGRVRFIQTQKDIRPYLWAADAFALPSHYEVFPLAVLEAAAAGLPVLVTALNGVDEFLRDGQNGILIGASTEEVVIGLQRLLALSPDERQAMGRKAQEDVVRYDIANFVHSWRRFYQELDKTAGANASSARSPVSPREWGRERV